jgi:MFS family permease
MRFILGCFVSATEPVGFSLVGDYFPKNMRGTANSIIGTASYIGAASAALILFITRALGWRNAYYCAGGFGLFVGILGLTFIKDPQKGLQEKVLQEINL